MSYATCEAAVQDLLQALANFASADVTLGSYAPLDAGNLPCVVLTPGTFEMAEAGDWGQKRHTWDVNVELFVRYVGEGTEWSDLTTARQAIVDQLHAYPTLNGVSGVTQVLVRLGREILSIRPAGSDRPAYLLQPMVVRVVEYVGYAGSGEYA